MNEVFKADLASDGTPFEQIINVGAVPGGEGYLLVSRNVTLLFDSFFCPSSPI